MKTEKSKQDLYREAIALLEYAEQLLLTARARHEQAARKAA